MLSESVDFEDALVPLSYGTKYLYLFSTVDGRLYIHDGRALQRYASLPPWTFAVPGDPVLYSINVTHGQITVDYLQLNNLATLDTVDVGEYSPSVAGKIQGVIERGHSRALVLRDQNCEWTTLIDIASGQARRLRIPQDAKVLVERLDESVVYQRGEVWGVISAETTSEAPGTVTSWCEDRFVVVTDPKDERLYSLFGQKGKTDLIPPFGWTLRQAVLRENGYSGIIVHPERGYGTWDGTKIHAYDGTIVIFGQGNKLPIIRQTGCSVGSRWMIGDRQFEGIAEPREDIQSSPIQIGDCPSVLLTKSGDLRRRPLLVSLHGGPDSMEWDDLRYGGMYRSLIDRGVDILVVNYQGSHGFGRHHQREAWGNWWLVARRLAEGVKSYANAEIYDEILLLGVSFGAWVALLMRETMEFKRIVLASPVIGLRAHIGDHVDQPEFSKWATARFGVNYESAIEGDARATREGTNITVVLGSSDEVLDVSRTTSEAKRLGWNVVMTGGSHYPKSLQDARTRWYEIESHLLGETQGPSNTGVTY